MTVEDLRTTEVQRQRGGRLRVGWPHWTEREDGRLPRERAVSVSVDRTAGMVEVALVDGRRIAGMEVPSVVWRRLVEYVEAITTGHVNEAA